MEPEQKREYGPRPKLSQSMSSTKDSQGCSSWGAVEFNPQDFEGSGSNIEKSLSNAGDSTWRQIESNQHWWYPFAFQYRISSWWWWTQTLEITTKFSLLTQRFISLLCCLNSISFPTWATCAPTMCFFSSHNSYNSIFSWRMKMDMAKQFTIHKREGMERTLLRGKASQETIQEDYTGLYRSTNK